MAALVKPGRPQILDAADAAGSQGFQTRLNQDFLQKGIADLHRGAQFLLRLQGARSQPGGPVNPVPPGIRPYQQQNAAGGIRRRRCQLVNGDDAHAHCVDQGILRIGLVEVDSPPTSGTPMQLPYQEMPSTTPWNR